MDKRAILVTQHGKEQLLAPVFATHGWSLEWEAADTDSLGTFSGDVPRRHSPLETARRKALLGVGCGDAPWLAASEGSITSATFGIVSDLEFVVLVKRSGSSVVVGRAVGHGVRAVQFQVDSTTSEEEVLRRCADADLPHHKLLVATSDHEEHAIGALSSAEGVLDACRRLAQPHRKLVIQTDFRAHLCPSRQSVIVDAAKDLMTRMSQDCPRCDEAGFGEEDPIPGRPCMDCGSPTDELMARRWVCPACTYAEVRQVVTAFADPSHCPWCNP